MRAPIVTLLIIVALTSVAFAQTAHITGRVTDSSHAVMPDVKVEITNAKTAIVRRTATNPEGYYSVPLLPPGEYRMIVRHDGFKPNGRERITLTVDQVARIDFVMEVGDVTESVVVEAGAPLVETSSATVGQVVNNRTITELPLNGRQFLQLATLAPGVATGISFGARQPGMRGALTSISVNGARPELNNYLLDGVTNIDGNNNLMVTSPSVDTLQEFKIQTNSYSAEFGRSVGAQINAITKSGTNAAHGSLYEFLRNDKLDGRNYFALPNQRKPPYRQNQFGASLGGPVYFPRVYDGRNRTFFFFNYEGLRIREA